MYNIRLKSNKFIFQNLFTIFLCIKKKFSVIFLVHLKMNTVVERALKELTEIGMVNTSNTVGWNYSKL